MWIKVFCKDCGAEMEGAPDKIGRTRCVVWTCPICGARAWESGGGAPVRVLQDPAPLGGTDDPEEG